MAGTLKKSPAQLDDEYWKAYLDHVGPCFFPRLTDGLEPPAHTRHQIRVDVEAEGRPLEQFCARNGIELPAVFQTAWALVLGRYVDAEDLSFGFALSSAQGSYETVCRAQLHDAVPMAQILQDMHAHHRRRSPYQPEGPSLFNTKVLFEAVADGAGEADPADVSSSSNGSWPAHRSVLTKCVYRLISWCGFIAPRALSAFRSRTRPQSCRTGKRSTLRARWPESCPVLSRRIQTDPALSSTSSASTTDSTFGTGIRLAAIRPP